MWERLLLDLGIIIALFLISFELYCTGRERAQRQVREEDVHVREKDIKAAGTHVSDSDEPIREWRQDLLGRSPIINAISYSLLITKTPVIALLGRFGSGKTSVLNLLQDHLEKEVKPKTIVVVFNTWLPGSPESLASYLLDDIARECNKLYVVPGLRKDARKLTLALAKSIPLLSSLSDLFSNSTQREDIQRLADAVSRLPRRVIVLLDEIDRMRKKTNSRTVEGPTWPIHFPKP